MRQLVLALLVLVAGAAHADFHSFMQRGASPGPLGRAHAALDDQCDKCHVPFQGIPDSACLACHTATQKRIASGVGTHAGFAKQGRKCSACHGDHKGRDHALSPTPGPDFDHRLTGVVLDGKHAGLACTSCHPKGPSGPRWVGIATDCSGCHADPHKGGLGGQCGKCHSSATWKPTTRTIADHQVPMTGKHAGLACAQCHAQGTHLVAKTSCGDCHAQDHGGTRAPCATCHNTSDWKSATFHHDFCTCILPGKHQTAPCLACHPKFKFLPTPFACAACHKKDLQHEDLGACSRCHSALSWKTRTFDHDQPRVGFKLEGKHLEVACENCHPKKGVFKAAPKACEGCHKVPEHGDFGPCAKCHSVAGWSPQSFSHDRTAFPLDGKHLKVGCRDCHEKFKPGQFVKGPNQCALCHDDPHQGQFGTSKTGGQQTLKDVISGIVVAANGTPQHLVSARFGCLDCHTTRGWTPSTVDVAKHAGFGYELKGQHASVPCARCHDQGRYVGTPHDCASCHLDRHRGQFGRDCARCHDERSFHQVPGFDHAVATGCALLGAHAGVRCAGCHGGDGRKLDAAARPIGCATCHLPRHGDQFGRDCAKCHQPTRFSDVPRFDHNRTMFPLDRRHGALGCTTCHDAQRFPRIDPSCRTCHGDPHRGRTQLDCGECHRADRFSLVRFDHDRTEFPLRGRHFTTPCRDCHVNDQYTGTRAECVSCHRGDRQRADQLHLDHRGNSFDCAACHNPFHF